LKLDFEFGQFLTQSMTSEHFHTSCMDYFWCFLVFCKVKTVPIHCNCMKKVTQ